jgi:Cu(I)/Ag(I) efflux system membrane fusion protein
MFQLSRWMMTGVTAVLFVLFVLGCSDQSGSQTTGDTGKAADADEIQSAVDAITEAYLTIQSKLAADSIENVQPKLQMLRQSAQSLQTVGENAGDQKLSARGAAIAQAADFKVTDVKQARDKLVDLSASVIALVQDHTPSDATAPALYLAKCPMVEDGLWLQTEKQVTNPYMGSRMLQCGSVQKAIKRPSPKGEGAAD